MSEPRTEAGRALAGMLTVNGRADPAMLDYVLTIEAECRDDPRRLGVTDKPPVLRLSGEQIDSISPAPKGDWFVDWDEYEEFVPKRAYDAVEAATAAAVTQGLMAAMRPFLRHKPGCAVYSIGARCTCGLAHMSG